MIHFVLVLLGIDFLRRGVVGVRARGDGMTRDGGFVGRRRIRCVPGGIRIRVRKDVG